MIARFVCGLSLVALTVTPVLAQKPLMSLPYTPGLDVSAMDRSADPCVDFYQFTCGGWMKNNPIPSDQASWSVYGKLTDENQQFLWGLLQVASDASAPNRDAATQKIGDYFYACMDEPAIEQRGASPLKSDLDAIAALKTRDQLAALVGRLHLSTGGSSMLFGFGSSQDLKDSSRVIAFAAAGGLGLPDRDYYTKTDAKSVETRAKYVAHIGRMLQLLGETPAAAAAHAKTIMRIETALAKASLTRVEKRDPYKLDHKMTLADFQATTPSFKWAEYYTAIGLADTKDLNVTEPAFYTAIDALIRTEPIANWQTYLRWHLVNARASQLSSRFVEADFDFYRRYLRGVKEMTPRWKRCVRLVDRDLGEALGQVFVEKTFGPDVKARTDTMVRLIDKAMETRIKELPWMSDATKAQALEKLHGMRNKIGYPSRWRDYSALTIARDDFAGNVARAMVFEHKRDLAKIGKPVDRDEWGMTPPTVNAYYDPQMNDINFPAGVLQPPLFDPKMDDAPNYGNTGGTIGHELTHGFDDEGRQFDAKGNLRDWWTESDAKEFERRASCVSDQYAKYTIVDDIKINSKLTLGEDVADLGGLIIAYVAWKEATAGQQLEPKDGLTPDQRFFVGYAQWACENERPENLRVSALTNPHSPGKYRVNGVVVNIPEFAKAFSCKPGQPMVTDNVCRIW
jgi:endothelin-converting enzyme/putative endopeptidase